MRLDHTEPIGAPIGLVFDVFTDLRRAPHIVDSVEKLELFDHGPIGKGTRFRETRRRRFARGKTDFEITAFEPNRTVTIESRSGGAQTYVVARFSEAAYGTDVHTTFESDPVTLFGAVRASLSGLLVGDPAKLIAADHADLRRECEVRAAEAAAAYAAQAEAAQSQAQTTPSPPADPHGVPPASH